jgi:hypothetical protein
LLLSWQSAACPSSAPAISKILVPTALQNLSRNGPQHSASSWGPCGPANTSLNHL